MNTARELEYACPYCRNRYSFNLCPAGADELVPMPNEPTPDGQPRRWDTKL